MSLAVRDYRVPDSPLAEWDARWKLAAILIAAGGIAALDHLLPTAAALALGSMMLAAARPRFGWVRARLAVFALAALPFLIILPFTLDGPGWNIGAISVSQHGVASGLAVFARCLAIGCLALVLVGTAPLHRTIAAAHHLRVPGVLVLSTLLAHRYAFLLLAELRRLRTSLWARGFRTRATRHGYRTLGHAIGIVLVRGSDRAERVADAMRCRGFDGRFHTLAAFHTKTKDVILFLLVASAAAGLVAWDRF